MTSPIICDWQSRDGWCVYSAAFYVEWDEGQLQFAGMYCQGHTADIRAGRSPFEEWGGSATVIVIRTVEAQLAAAAASRAAMPAQDPLD